MKKRTRKKRTERSPRQQWHSERNWELHGTLEGLYQRLGQLSRYPSLTEIEQGKLAHAAGWIEEVLSNIKKKKNEEESYKLFCKRKGFIS